ncbi:MAG: T9SS type A sorting domain-containing protein, partial [Bacteroidota bacterium]
QYTASMFASFDPVAIESVGFDFISGEYTAASEPVQMNGVDDYLHQAADTTNWPAGIAYDPNGTGVHLKSLGVHEHWNDTLHKEYSRNLGSGLGIELIQATTIPTSVQNSKSTIASSFKLYANYPNPFNPSTRINYDIPAVSNVTLKIFDMLGRNVMTVVDQIRSPGSYTETVNCSKLASGVYLYRLQAHPLSGQTGDLSATRKFVLTK